MVIQLLKREHNYCSMLASTPECVYNAWKRGNTLHFYILSNDTATVNIFRDVVDYFTVQIENGEIKLVIDGVAFTLYSHDELINTIRCAFPDDDWHDIITIIETLLYRE